MKGRLLTAGFMRMVSRNRQFRFDQRRDCTWRRAREVCECQPAALRTRL